MTNMALFRSKAANRAFYGCLSLLIFIVLLVSLVIPVLFRCFPGLIRGFIFVPNEEVPENLDFKNPESSGFFGARNVYLTTEDGATLGVWHILPANLESEAQNLNLTLMNNASATEIYNDWMSGADVFLYLHGSAGTRTSPHRLRLYRLLSDLNYHVVAFDYRGYGDSSSTPTSETDLIKDTITVFNWISAQTQNIFIWGHSLGTGVAAHTSDLLVNGGETVKAIVLEAPFNNMADAVRSSRLAEKVSFLPWFNYCFIDPLFTSDLAFESDKHLMNISTNVLILHAKDDKIVPYRLAVQLYDDVLKSRKDASSVELVGYDSSLGYGHYNIALDPNLNNTISQFIEKIPI